MTNHHAIAERLRFLKLDDEAQSRLRQARRTVARELPAALDRLYAQIAALPDTRALLATQAQVNAVRARQQAHWETLLNGEFDQGYVREATAIGEAHARAGLNASRYIGGYALVLEALLSAVVAAEWPKGGFGGKGAGPKAAVAGIGALTKAAFLDLDLALGVYLEAAEAERRKAAEEAAARAESQGAVMKAISAGMAALAAGDLTYRLSTDIADEYGALRADFNAAMARLEEALAVVSANAGGISAGVSQISEASDDLSRRTEQQAASLEETAAALDQITATVKKTADGARQASAAVSSAKSEAARSGAVVSEAVSAMGQIEGSSRQISQIIGVIDEIAFQTNLLALNAGVEAARAGDAGRGFAVVAQEVRALAQRSADAAKEIKTLISASSEQVEQGVSLVGQTGEALQSIVSKVSEIDALVAEIAASAEEQSTGLAEVNSAVNQMDQVVQQNAAMVEQSTAAAHSLGGETAELANLISRFRLSGGRSQGQGSARARPAAKAAPQPAPRAASPVESPARAMTRKIAASFNAAPPAQDEWEEFNDLRRRQSSTDVLKSKVYQTQIQNSAFASETRPVHRKKITSSKRFRAQLRTRDCVAAIG
ncbi:MAG: globin-coupled sensor protein [Caulobacteraceae bacterium]|nr:globin-coupled sensor protein [Caulobacteraceae bacterium]